MALQVSKSKLCQYESDIVHRCFKKYDFDKSKCSKEILNYNTCKKFWTHVVNERRRKDQKPYVPTEQERNQLKKDFIKNEKYT
ncbi:unnamed protein product [Gordionus sp. m RMFG-2023]